MDIRKLFAKAAAKPGGAGPPAAPEKDPSPVKKPTPSKCAARGAEADTQTESARLTRAVVLLTSRMWLKNLVS